MGEWQFLDPASRGNLMEAWERESEGMFELAADPDRWKAPTGAGHWEVRDVIGHLVDTTETYFIGFDTARGEGEGPENLGLRDMALNVNKGAQAFRDTPQSELLARLKDDRDQMMGIAADLTDDEWSEMLVPHKYMGPLPAPFYPLFQVVDYGVHSWDIREGTGMAHARRRHRRHPGAARLHPVAVDARRPDRDRALHHRRRGDLGSQRRQASGVAVSGRPHRGGGQPRRSTRCD